MKFMHGAEKKGRPLGLAFCLTKGLVAGTGRRLDRALLLQLCFRLAKRYSMCMHGLPVHAAAYVHMQDGQAVVLHDCLADVRLHLFFVFARWTTLLAVLPDALYTDRCHYFECIIALMTRYATRTLFCRSWNDVHSVSTNSAPRSLSLHRKEFDEFGRAKQQWNTAQCA